MPRNVVVASTKPVICAHCGTKYRSELPEDVCRGKQGDGCAASVYQLGDQLRLRGHYGSRRFDLHVYRVVMPVFDVGTDPVCDDCIQLQIEGGALELVTESADCDE